MPSTDETKTPTTGDASVPMDKSSFDKLLEAIQASAAVTRVLGSRFDRVEQDLAEVKASQTARADGSSPAMMFGSPITPQILRPGIAPGLPSRPGQTPMQATPVARGVSGFFVPISPQKIKDKPEANAPPNAGIGLGGLSLAQGNGVEQSASERISAARLISNSLSEEGQRHKAELWANCLPIVEKDNPGASDEEIAAKLDRMVAEQWLQMRRELIMRDFEVAADGKPKSGARDNEKPAAAKKEWQRKISQNAPSRVQNKLTHANYMDWVSEIIGILAPIQGATEILEGIEYGPGYNLADPKSSTDNYELSLDLEIGGLLSGTVTAECRGYVLARQSQGEHRGSILWRDLVGVMQRNDGVGKSTILEQVLGERQKVSEGVRAYAERLRTLFIKSASINAPFSASDQVMYLLRGLQRHLETPRATIRGFQSQGSVYTFDQALLFLVEQEAAMVYDQHSNRPPLLSRPAANLASESSSQSSLSREPRRFHILRNTASKGQPGYFNGECRHCRKWGHKAEDCAQRKREIDSGSDKQASAKVALADAEEGHEQDGDGDTQSDTDGDIFELIGEDGEVFFARLATGSVPDQSEANIARAMVAAASQAALAKPAPWTDEQRHAFAEVHIPDKAVRWILDSGATHHMTSMPELLPIRVGASSDAVVHIADGSTAKVTRRGACVASLFGDGGSEATAMLKSVLVVPSFTNNLLSVQRLTEDGWTIKFTKHGAELTSPSGEQVQTFTEPATRAPYLMLKTQPSRVIDIKGASKRIGPAKATARIAEQPQPESQHEVIGHDAAPELPKKEDNIWHRRLAQAANQVLRILFKNPAFSPRDRPSLEALSKHIAAATLCDPCVEARQPLLKFGTAENKPEEKLGDVHFDLSGHYEGSKEYKYALHILDAWSRMLWTYPLPNKEAATVFAVFESWANLMKTQGHGTVKRLHCDHGGEFENHLFQEWARQNGVAWHFAAPNTSQQNGLIERWNRTVQDHARTMLRAARLSDAFWPYAFRAASDIINKLPSSAIGFAIPLTKWSDKPIDYDGVRVFGCLCWVIKPSKNRKNKLSIRAVRGTYLGPAPEHKAHLVYTPAERPFLRISRHVIFDETRTYDARFALDSKQEHAGASSDITELVAPRRAAKLSDVPPEHDPAPEDKPVLDWEDDEADYEADVTIDNAIVTEQLRGDEEGNWPSLDSLFGEDDEQEDLATNEWTGELERFQSPERMPPSVHGIRNSYPELEGLGDPITLDNLDEAFESTPDTPTKTITEPTVGAVLEAAPPPRRSARLRAPFKALAASVGIVLMASVSGELHRRAQALAAKVFGNAIRASADGVPIEPKSLAEAKSRDDWARWEAGMNEEIKSLDSMKTWVLTELPPGRKPVGCRWTYKLKLDSEGKATRWKARLVAQGFSQRAGVDYSETFAPVARLTTVRILIALAARHRLTVWSMDVVTAYLNGTIGEDIYMSQPPHFDDGTGRVCKLKRSLYGLKQSGREWFVTIVAWLVEQGFRGLQCEPCVFVKTTSSGELIIIVLYVDDVLIAAKTQSTIDSIRAAFAQRFKMTDNGILTQVLGLKININHETGTAAISQEAYIDAIVRRFGLEGANSVDSPMTAALQGIGPRTEGQASSKEVAEYASIVGCLMWAAQGTRPDIAYAVGRLGRFMANPRPEHIVGAKRVLRYLKGTSSIGLVYSASHNPQIEGFCDADHAKDLTTRRSVSGYAFFIHGNLVSWRSRLQATVAISSTESEYVAMSEAAREAKWLRSFTTSVNLAPRRPTDIFTDSSGAYSLARNPEGHNKLKHIDTHHHFVRELVADQQVNFTQIGTDENAADIFTKVTSISRLHEGMMQLGMGDNRRADA